MTHLHKLLAVLVLLLVTACPSAEGPGGSETTLDGGDTGAVTDVTRSDASDIDPFDGFSVGGQDTTDRDTATPDAMLDTDLGCTALQYPDLDGDGFGDPQGTPVTLCTDRVGFARDATDCDDTQPTIFPMATDDCDGLDNDCNGVIDDQGCPGCAVERNDTTGHAYLFCAATMPWPSAQAACSSQGYHLVTVNDAAEDTWLRTYRDQYNLQPPWIGLNDRAVEGVFAWEDGTPFAYDNWDTGEPNDGGGNEDCGIWRENGPRWDDRPCNVSFAFICESP